MEQSSACEVNQQGSLDSDVKWLAGIMDSEGRISSSHHHAPTVSIVNCNQALIQDVEHILSRLNISYHRYVRSNRYKNWKDIYTIQINSTANVSRLLQFLQPHLIGKQEVCRLAMQWIELRQGKTTQPIDTECRAITEQMSVCNQRGDETPQRLYAERSKGPMIQSGLHGDMQSAAETTVPSLDWLGGFIDGDGCITAVLGQSGKHSIPRISVINTNLRSMRAIARLLSIHDQDFYAGSLPKVGTRKTAFQFDICGHKRCGRTVRLILPYVRAKKQQAELLAQYVESRKGKGSGAGYPCTSEEIYLCQRIRGLNRRGK